jgi:hypothetical protein
MLEVLTIFPGRHDILAIGNNGYIYEVRVAVSDDQRLQYVIKNLETKEIVKDFRESDLDTLYVSAYRKEGTEYQYVKGSLH